MRIVVRRLGRVKLVLIITIVSVFMAVVLNFGISLLFDHDTPIEEGILRAALIPLVIAPAVSWYLLGLLLDLDQLEEKMNQLATYDDLTGLYNRRSLFKSCNLLHRLGLRSKKTYSVMLLDLDHFKKINDQYGHAAGDQVLKAFGQVLHEVTRDSDIVGRIGGEEFCLFLGETSENEVQPIVNRINYEIKERPVLINDQPINYTVSMGVAENSFEQELDFEAILNRADIALYAAKNSGRNKVMHYNES